MNEAQPCQFPCQFPVSFPVSFAIAVSIASSLTFAQPQDAVARPKVLGVAHLAVYVKDLAKTRQFYQDFMGFGEAFTLPKKGGEAGVRIAFFKVMTTSTSRSSMRRTGAKVNSITSPSIPTTPTRCTHT